MSINLAQFHQTFFEESFEGLDTMEAGLLSLSEGRADADTINTIFRATHSIKGGSATFGFSAVAKFTHVMETLLDEMRGERIAPSETTVNVLLRSVDCLRAMLEAVKSNTTFDEALQHELYSEMQHILDANPDAPAAVSGIKGGGTKSAAASGWTIGFRPHAHLLRTGNDPLRLLRELGTLGKLNVKADVSGLPPFAEMNPENCYLRWEISLRAAAPHQAVAEIFNWVDGDCDLDIRANAEPSVSTPVSISTETAQAAPPVKAERSVAAESAASIRVSTDKVDALVNMVGELVITQSMLSQLGEDFSMERILKLRDGLAQLERNTRELQESVMRIRMMPISHCFSRIPRMVHDLCHKLGKKVEVRLSGEQTELDKTVLEKIGDPLVHLVRNSLDHGIEKPEARAATGKSEIGTLCLNAFHKGGNIVIEISDDGAGLNKDKILAKAKERGLIKGDEPLGDEKIYELIFLPGFSTAEVVSDVSGRGVGMDVVRRNIKSLNGKIEIESQASKGTTIRIRLPLTLAILDGMSIAVNGQMFIIPLTFIAESLQPKPEDIQGIAGRERVVRVRGDYVPVIALYELFNIPPRITQPEQGILVLVEAEGRKIALFIDEIMGQHQVVLKSLESNYRKVDGIAGATIMGDGTVAVILDVAALVRLSREPRAALQREAA
jgi:two-component system chemotaxis sensor kinase CheA